MRCELFLLTLLTLSFCSAAPSFDFQNDEIQPGETILGTISTVGEFTEKISPDRLLFYEGRKEIFIEYDLTEYNGTYYFYAYPNRPGNFTLKINNVLYNEADQLNSIDLEKSFEVKTISITFTREENLSGNLTQIEDTKTEILQIKPGFSKYDNDPKIKLINKGSADLDISFDNSKVSLLSGEVLEIPINFTEELFYSFEVSSYKDFTIPIIRRLDDLPSKNSSIENGSIDKKPDLRSSLDEVILNLVTFNETSLNLELFNFGQNNLTNFEFKHSLDFLKISEFNYLRPKDVKNLSLNFSSSIEGSFEDNLSITYTLNDSSYGLIIPLSIKVLPNGTNITDESFEESDETCSSLSGTVCLAGENCEGEPVWTKNSETGEAEYCCLGSCVASKASGEDKNYSWLFGLIILAALGIGGYVLYKKQKNIVPENPQNTIQKTTENYSKRMSGSIQRS